LEDLLRRRDEQEEKGTTEDVDDDEQTHGGELLMPALDLVAGDVLDMAERLLVGVLDNGGISAAGMERAKLLLRSRGMALAVSASRIARLSVETGCSCEGSETEIATGTHASTTDVQWIGVWD
jgi:hypothetical protein